MEKNSLKTEYKKLRATIQAEILKMFDEGYDRDYKKAYARLQWR